MIPGLTTRLSEETVASATTIYPRADLVKLTGTTAIAGIYGQFNGGFSGILFVVPLDGTVSTTTADNIGAVVVMPQARVTVLVFSRLQNKWYPGAIS